MKYRDEVGLLSKITQIHTQKHTRGHTNKRKPFTYLAHVHFEGFVDDGKSRVVLNVLPSSVAVDHNASKKPVVVSKKRSDTID